MKAPNKISLTWDYGAFVLGPDREEYSLTPGNAGFEKDNPGGMKIFGNYLTSMCILVILFLNK